MVLEVLICSLGCDIGFGYLHRIPLNRNLPSTAQQQQQLQQLQMQYPPIQTPPGFAVQTQITQPPKEQIPQSFSTFVQQSPSQLPTVGSQQIVSSPSSPRQAQPTASPIISTPTQDVKL